MTTAREREVFRQRITTWLDAHLEAAPLEQIQAVESALFRFKPGVSHQFRDDPPIYGINGP